MSAQDTQRLMGMAEGAAVQAGEGRATRRGWRVLFFGALTAAAAVTVGFACYVASLPSHEIAITRNADGIVVLTGGSSRVSDGMDLLAAERARRLLISGVRVGNGRVDISRAMPEHQKLLTCCVDLGRFAINTRGNAVEARRWAGERGFRSLIVVTSNYHMPRAISEFSHAMPGIDLIPYPVVGDQWRSEPWWTSGATARLLLVEYVKFLFAEARIRLNAAGLLPETGEDGLFGSAAMRKPKVAAVH
jgi:uncharacterized SAM-binding protein YcdF (DUF218 family)